MLGCLYAVPSHLGQITISWFTGPVTDEDIAKLITMSKNNVGTDDLRKANYKEVAKDFSHAWCSTFTPPASAKDGLPMSTCADGAKSQALSITFMSPTKVLTNDQAKALLDKAVGRLHCRGAVIPGISRPCRSHSTTLSPLIPTKTPSHQCIN